MESAASGIMAGKNAVLRANEKDTFVLDDCTMIGALSRYIRDGSVENFQPMGANFGVLPPIEPKIRDKRERYMALAQRSLENIEEVINDENYC